MTTTDDETDDWIVWVAPRGVRDTIFFLRKIPKEGENSDLAAAGYDADASRYLYTGDGEIAISWADRRAAEAVQMLMGGEIIEIRFGRALARAANSGQAFVLRTYERDYVLDFRPRHDGTEQ
jgi:hypothetical protein